MLPLGRQSATSPINRGSDVPSHEHMVNADRKTNDKGKGNDTGQSVLEIASSQTKGKGKIGVEINADVAVTSRRKHAVSKLIPLDINNEAEKRLL
ncbi:hypothetical protein ACOSQ2_031425 [Xanthoceras sorbifolium]